jgi:hypothetical protein
VWLHAERLVHARILSKLFNTVLILSLKYDVHILGHVFCKFIEWEARKFCCNGIKILSLTNIMDISNVKQTVSYSKSGS